MKERLLEILARIIDFLDPPDDWPTSGFDPDDRFKWGARF